MIAPYSVLRDPKKEARMNSAPLKELLLLTLIHYHKIRTTNHSYEWRGKTDLS
jgi:hypothetical protein